LDAVVGTWGPGIFSDDVAADVREEFRDLIADGLTPAQATERLKGDYDGELDPDEVPVFLLALAATQWKTGHVVPAVIEQARAALESGAGMERWEEASPSDRKSRRRALDKLAQQLRTPPRAPVRIPRRKLEDTTLELGDVVAVPRGAGRIFFAVVDFHVEKGGRAAVVKLLPFLDRLSADSAAVREVAGSATREELEPFFIVFNGGRAPARLPSHVEVVAKGLVDSPSELTGGTVTWWSDIAESAEPALRRMGLS
jgi:hypothetical protein